MSRLVIKGVSKKFKQRLVVNKVSFQIESGEVVGLLGPNGAGKTTSFYMVVGLLTPDSGEVDLDGNSIGDMPMYLRARRGLSYLPQEPSIFRHLTVAAIAFRPSGPLTCTGRTWSWQLQAAT